MPLLHDPFLKVLAISFAQGLILWGISLFADPLPDWVSLVWAGVFGSIVAWWSIWLALSERGWQPWLEWLALMGASYWLPVLLDPWVRHDHDAFIPLSMILYAVLAFSVLVSSPVALVFMLIARLGIGWRLESRWPVQKFGLRGMFLLMLVVSGHLMAFLVPLRKMVENREFGLDDAAGIGLLTLFMMPVVAVVLGGSGFVLSRNPLVSLILLSAGVFTLLVIYFVTNNSNLGPLLAILSLVVYSLLQALALRWLGYRITGRRERREPLPSDKLASAS
jgi:hypothetical protein